MLKVALKSITLRRSRRLDQPVRKEQTKLEFTVNNKRQHRDRPHYCTISLSWNGQLYWKLHEANVISFQADRISSRTELHYKVNYVALYNWNKIKWQIQGVQIWRTNMAENSKYRTLHTGVQRWGLKPCWLISHNNF